MEIAIPHNWKMTSIDTITLPVLKINQSEFLNDVIRYIDISSIDNVKYKICDHKEFILKNAPSRARQIIKTGDVLFSTVRPYLKNIANVPNEYDGEIASTGFSVLRPGSELNPQYLYYYCTYRYFINSLTEDQYGVSYPAVKDSQVRQKQIPLAPFGEQQRIVDKIEELFSELDKGIESLKTAREQLKVYRQALLKHAFEGKLTEQWRAAQGSASVARGQESKATKDNADKLETADQLLSRIQQEREIRYQQQLDTWNKAVKKWEVDGKEGKKPFKPKKYQPTKLEDSDKASLSNLPVGWIWVNFSELLNSIRGGTTVPPTDNVTNYPILRSSSVRSGVIDYKDVRYLFKDKIKSNQDFVETGDLLFSRLNGTIEFVGNCAVIGQNFPANLMYPDRLYCAKLTINDLGKYCEYFFASPVVRSHIEEKAKSTAGHKRISIPDITDYPLQLPSVEEAREISNLLDEKFSLIRVMEKDIDENIIRSESLRQSILKKAFSGQLVPQDPTDEPASVLLERIKAEKENFKKIVPKKKKRVRRKDVA